MAVELECMYSEMELRIASMALNGKFEKDPTLAEKLKSLEPKDNSPKAIAEYYGVTQLELINSNNYKELVDQYQTLVVKDLIERLKSEVGLEDKEAWCVVLLASGNLN